MANGSLDRVFVTPFGGEIWQGNAESAARGTRTFDLVVLCAEEFQPSLASNRAAVLHAPYDDTTTPTSEHLRTAEQAAGEVARTVALDRRCLVTCMAGLNRSGLVSALAIHMLTGCGGTAARWLVRRRRPGALSNPTFRRTLDQIPRCDVVSGTSGAIVLPLLVALPFVPP